MKSLVADLQSVLDRLLGLLGLNLADARRTTLRIAVIWLLAFLGWQLVKWAARRIRKVADDHHTDVLTLREKRAETISSLLHNVGRGVLLLVAVLLTLNEFISVTPLLGGAAILGLAVSFGAQSLVKDFFAGFFILMENQFLVGDKIEAAGKVGVVERLTLRTVTIRDVEGTVHIIPNGQITILSNRTRGWSRAIVDITVSYRNDIDAVIAAMRDEARKFSKDPEWSQMFDAAPEVAGVESLGDTGVVVRTLLRTQPGVKSEIAREYRRRVLLRLRHDGFRGAEPIQPAPWAGFDHAEDIPDGPGGFRDRAAPPAPPPKDTLIPGSE